MKKIPQELITSFEATYFHVSQAKHNFTLRVNEYSPELDALQKDQAIKSSAYITAFNPESTPLTKEQNKARNIMLEKELQQNNYNYLEGYGEDAEGSWSSEESFLVLSINKSDAVVLGDKYGQFAIVFSEADAIPKLLFIRGHV
jgi:hypothetical protein